MKILKKVKKRRFLKINFSLKKKVLKKKTIPLICGGIVTPKKKFTRILQTLFE